METVHRSKSLPEIKIVTAQLFTLLALCLQVHAAFDCSKLKVFSENGTQINTSSVCNTRYPLAECRNFTLSFDQSQLPVDFPRWKPGESVEASDEVNVVGTGYEFESWAYPGMSVRFNSPSSGIGRKHVLGYLLALYRGTGSILSCILFQFNNGSELLENKLRYQYDISKVDESTTFHVRLYTLPTDPPGEIKPTEITVVTPPAFYTPPAYALTQPADWAPFLAYQTFDNGSIVVKFTLPPPSLNLTKFEVTLTSEYNPAQSVDSIRDFRPGIFSAESPQAIVMFNVTVSGTYKVKIWVRDEYFKDKEKCNCWRIEGGEKKCQTTCASTSTEWFALNVTSTVTPTSAVKTEETTHYVTTPGHYTTTPEHYTTIPGHAQQPGGDNHIPEIIAGSIVGAAVLVVLALLICWRKRERVKKLIPWFQRTDDQKKPYPGQGTVAVDSEPCLITFGPPTKKTVYIISAEDNEAHTELVECFAKFLQVHCHCHVITQSDYDYDRLSCYEWFISSVNKADYIIFVDSQGAKSMIMAYLKIILKRVAPDEFFLYGLKHLLMNQEARENKLVLVSFQGNHCQTYLHASTIYTLPEDLPKFLGKIHKISAKNSKAYDNWLPMHTENIENVHEGKQLLSAISFAKTYEKNNPDWFNTKYGPELNSIDSGFHSTLLSSQGLSVSTVDMTISETTSPVSVFGEPNFPVHMNSPTGISSGPPAIPYRFSESQKQATDNVLDNISALTDCTDMNRLQIKTVGAVPDENTSWVTVPHSQFIQEHEREEEDGMEQERNVLFDKMSVVAPESASVMNVDSINTALNNINNNEESRSECPQQLTSQPGTFCLDFADRELKEEEFQASLNPPDTLSNIKVEESVSRALVNINADNDTLFLGGHGSNHNTSVI